MLGHLLEPELLDMIQKGELQQLRGFLVEMEAADVADMIDDMPLKENAVIFRILPRDLAADVFECLPLEAQERIVRGLAENEVALILNNMAPDSRTMLLEELPSAVTRQALSLLSLEELKVAKTLLGYPEDSVGRLMTPDYLTLREDWTVAQALEHIRAHGHDTETLNVLYVIDERGRLLDDMRLRELILASPNESIRNMMDRQIISLNATDDQESAVIAFRKYDRTVLPVTDSLGVLLGIVTVDDVLDVATEEATEDIHKIGGLTAIETPYLTTRLRTMIRKRAGWLIVLFIGEMLTATAMGFFEKEIAQAVVLALFLPLIISSGGNSGSQAASLVIRALALGEVHVRDWWRVMRREVVTGLALGLTLGVFGFARVSLGSALTGLYVPHSLLLGTTIGLALVGVVMWGTLMGSLLPILLQKCRIDPATASAPAVATLVDVFGLVIYFGAAILILRGTLL